MSSQSTAFLSSPKTCLGTLAWRGPTQGPSTGRISPARQSASKSGKDREGSARPYGTPPLMSLPREEAPEQVGGRGAPRGECLAACLRGTSALCSSVGLDSEEGGGGRTAVDFC